MNAKLKAKLAAMSAVFIVSAAFLSGCVSLSVSSSSNYVNGWDSVTQHLDIYNTVTGVGIGVAGFDVWPYGISYECGFEDVGDRSGVGPLVSGIPADFATLDAVIGGELTADGFADLMVPAIMGNMRADPAFGVKLSALVDNIHALDGEHYATAADLAMERYGIDIATVTHENAEAYLTTVIRANIVNGAFPALEESLAPMKELGLTFTEDSLDPIATMTGIGALAEGLELNDPAALGAIADGKVSLSELETVADGIGGLNHKVDLHCLGIGIIYVHANFIGAGEHEYIYYKQIAAPLPVDALKTQRISVDVNWGVDYRKHIVLDSPALLLSGPSLKMPLVGVYATGQDVDFSMLAFNLGWEGGEVTLTESMPWGAESTTRAFGPGLTENEEGEIEIALEVVNNPVRIPPQDTHTVAVTTGTLDVIDDDTGKKGLKNDPAPGRHLWQGNGFFDAFGLGFTADTSALYKPLDVILVAEPTTGGSPEVPTLPPLPPEGEEAKAFLDQAAANAQEQVEFTVGQVMAELRDNGVPVDDIPDAGGIEDELPETGLEVTVDTDTSASELWARAAWGPGIRFHTATTVFDLAEQLNTLDLTPEEGDDTGLSAFRDFPNTVVFLGPSSHWFATPGAVGFMNALNDVGIGVVQDADAYMTGPFVGGAGYFLGATTPEGVTVGNPGDNGNGWKDTTNAAPIASYKGASLIVPSDFALPTGSAVAAFNEAQTGVFLAESHSADSTLDAARNVDAVGESTKDTAVQAAADLYAGNDAAPGLEAGAGEMQAGAETAAGNMAGRASAPAALPAGAPAAGGNKVGVFIPLDEDDPTLGTGWLVGFMLNGQGLLIAPDLQTAAAGDAGWLDASGRMVSNAGFSLSAGVFFADPTPM